jgi:D-threonate/D-erythronate kinase
VKSVVVIADDRTGAMETAGACADLRCDAIVVPYGVKWPPGAPCTVVDLATRHLSPSEAQARATSAPADALHKIDSTLRGAWAHEIVGRQQAHAVRVVVAPAFPAAGRTCEGGVVMIDGVPVADGAAATDARGPVRSSRPADHLRAAGARAVVEVTPKRLIGWVQSSKAPIAVCDARTDADLGHIASVCATHEGVVLAGTARAIGYGACKAIGPTAPLPLRPSCDPPALVVCGSLHPMALAQAAAAEAAGIDVLRPSSPGLDDAAEVATVLGAVAREAIESGRFATVVIVGGDTAAAVLGDRVVVVGGTLAPGVAWSWAWGDDGPLLLTKPGGFGTPSSVVDLVAGAPR